MHWSPIHVAVACLPQGLVGLVMGGVTQFVPQIITKPRITMPIGALRECRANPSSGLSSGSLVISPGPPLIPVIIAAEILQIYSDGGHGMNYWKYCFPAFSESNGCSII